MKQRRVHLEHRSLPPGRSPGQPEVSVPPCSKRAGPARLTLSGGVIGSETVTITRRILVATRVAFV